MISKCEANIISSSSYKYFILQHTFTFVIEPMDTNPACSSDQDGGAIAIAKKEMASTPMEPCCTGAIARGPSVPPLVYHHRPHRHRAGRHLVAAGLDSGCCNPTGALPPGQHSRARGRFRGNSVVRPRRPGQTLRRQVLVGCCSG